MGFVWEREGERVGVIYKSSKIKNALNSNIVKLLLKLKTHLNLWYIQNSPKYAIYLILTAESHILWQKKLSKYTEETIVILENEDNCAVTMMQD